MPSGDTCCQCGPWPAARTRASTLPAAAQTAQRGCGAPSARSRCESWRVGGSGTGRRCKHMRGCRGAAEVRQGCTAHRVHGAHRLQCVGWWRVVGAAWLGEVVKAQTCTSAHVAAAWTLSTHIGSVHSHSYRHTGAWQAGPAALVQSRGKCPPACPALLHTRLASTLAVLYGTCACMMLCMLCIHALPHLSVPLPTDPRSLRQRLRRRPAYLCCCLACCAVL